MALNSFRVFRIDPEFYQYGRFVIDAPSDDQEEIFALLSDQDRRMIALRLHIIPNLDWALPSGTLFQLGRAFNVTELPETPDFTSEGGHRIWIL